MNTDSVAIRRLPQLDASQVQQLAEILLDCVNGGYSIGFMQPISHDRALQFWNRVAAGVAAGERAILVAENAHGIVGTVQLVVDLPDNQPHRADVVKMLVASSARRQGIGAALMRAAEEVARDMGKTLLVLDAVTGGDASRLYERVGWIRVGNIPRYALFPSGDFCSTTYYYRNLAAQA